ncbi:MAG: transcriptional regulator GcvA [Rhodospirillales bacterium]
MIQDHDKRRLPQLRALEVFEAAARHQNFTAAGRDIGITQSAVSRQVTDLEAQLGCALFARSGPNVRLTPAGASLASGIGRGLEEMRRSVEAVSALRGGRVVTLSMLPSVAAKWLAPRLGRFTQAHPDLDLRISATRHLVDFAAEGIDAAIRYGQGRWPGVQATLLGVETVRPVVTPEYARATGLSAPADLLRATLLYAEIAEDWRAWFAAVGLTEVRVPPGPKLGDDTAILQAALDHQGVALGRSLLVASDLESGRLVAPFPTALKASFSYWFVTPLHTKPSPGLTAVRDWIVAQFAQQE